MDDTNAAVIAGPNYVDATYYTVRLFGGSWLSSAGLSQLQDPILSLPAISSDALATSTKFMVDLGTSRDIQFIGIPDADISRDGRIRWTGTDTPKWAGATLTAIRSAGASVLGVRAGTTGITIQVGDVFSISGHDGEFISNTSVTLAAGGSANIALQTALVSNVAASAALTCHTGDFSGVVASVVYAGDWEDYWPIVFADESLPWEHPSFWDGKRTDEDAQYYPLPYIKVFASAAQTARYWRCEIDDAGNSNGFITVSRLFMSQGWVGQLFLEYGMSLGFETDTQTSRTRAGAKLHDVGPQRRVATFTIPAVDRDEALQNPFDMQKRLGTSEQVFVVLDKDDAPNLHRLAFIGTMRQLPPQEFFWFDANRVPYEVEEDVA